MISPFRTVLTRRPSARMSEGALTFMARAPVDAALAERQHEAYRAAMASTGAAVIDAPAGHGFPDCSFVEDVVLAFPECFVLTRPASSRAGEPPFILPYLPDDRPVLRLEAPAMLEGGDVLPIGRDVFVGLSSRTNEAGVAAIRELLAPYGYRIAPVPVTGALHLKTAVTAARDDLLVANPAWADLTSFGDRRILVADRSEPFAGNCLAIGDRVFTDAAHPRTAARLRDAGLTVVELDISEFAKVEAGLTCMSVRIPPPAQ